jgi:cell division protein FtsN
MSEQNFREIQLTGKQLVFLFMASIVLAVAVFLLGVSVGRGVGQNAGLVESADEAGPLADAVVPEPLPETTQMSARDRSYVDQLQAAPSEPPPAVTEPDAAAGVPEPPPAPPASTATTPAPAASTPAMTPPDRIAAAATPSRTSAQAPDRAAPAAAPPSSAASANGQWFVQVDAFRVRENADRRVAQLKDRGLAGFVTANGPLFHVRVGPYPQRAEAERTANRLRQDGLKPIVTR